MMMLMNAEQPLAEFGAADRSGGQISSDGQTFGSARVGDVGGPQPSDRAEVCPNAKVRPPIASVPPQCPEVT